MSLPTLGDRVAFVAGASRRSRPRHRPSEGGVAGGINVPPDMIEELEAMGLSAVYRAARAAETLTGTAQYSLDLRERIGEPAGVPGRLLS